MKLISKYKVIDNIKSIICRGGDAQDILKMVNQMKPLALKVGYWIEREGNRNPYCSECKGISDRSPYCPHCGSYNEAKAGL